MTKLQELQAYEIERLTAELNAAVPMALELWREHMPASKQIRKLKAVLRVLQSMPVTPQKGRRPSCEA